MHRVEQFMEAYKKGDKEEMALIVLSEYVEYVLNSSNNADSDRYPLQRKVKARVMGRQSRLGSKKLE